MHAPRPAATSSAMSKTLSISIAARIAATASMLCLATAAAGELRIGMIGLDTSHVTAFTQLLNGTNAANHVAGGKVVAAFKGGSPDLPDSANRVDGYAKELVEKYGVKLYDSIPTMCQDVDVVMLESVDGRPHLAQARPVIEAGKRIFIDKPVAGSLKDAVEIFRLAKQHGVPCFSSSSLRYYPGLVELKAASFGALRGAISTGPCPTEPHHPDMFWYGVHPTEALFAVMGAGCERVVRTHTDNTDIVTGTWANGTVGTVVGIRNATAPYRVTVFGEKAVIDQKPGGDYAPLVKEVMRFFETGVAPVTPRETLELFAFMEAADESKRENGKPISIKETLAKAGYAP